MKRRTFLVTGASKGIGRALSQRLHDAGHDVIGVARGADAGFPGKLVSIDLGDSVGAGHALAELARQYPIDGVVNNVGFVRLHRLGEIRLDEVDELMKANLHPTILATQAALGGMLERGWGRVVSVSSLVVLGVAQRSAYAAAKAAINSLTRTWALELARSGITVNAVAPGPIETEMFRQNTPIGSEKEQQFLSLIPMARLGKPDEIAATIAFLLSEEAGYITGQTLFVDGGGSVGKSQD